MAAPNAFLSLRHNYNFACKNYMSVCKMLTTPHAYSQSPLFHHCLKDNVCPWNQGHCNWGTCASHVHWKIRRTAKPNRNGQQKWKEIVFIVCVKVDLNHFTMYLANHRLLLKAVSGKPARLTIRVLLVLVSDLSNSSKTKQILSWASGWHFLLIVWSRAKHYWKTNCMEMIPMRGNPLH